jgi:hypothetical protein
MANNQYRIEIPQDPTAAIALLTAIKTKHESLAAASPLAGLKWTRIAPALAEATAQDQLSDEHHRKAQAATGARDVEMPAIMDAIRSARDVLFGLNRDNPDALGDFGFKVSDARAGESEPAPAPPAG